jgi:voltage-dependent calcium channel alpha-2/delta-3
MIIITIFRRRTLGVVGVDATLEEIEHFLNRHTWGTVYSFVINTEGETIFHPRLKPSEDVRTYMKDSALT